MNMNRDSLRVEIVFGFHKKIYWYNFSIKIVRLILFILNDSYFANTNTTKDSWMEKFRLLSWVYIPLLWKPREAPQVQIQIQICTNTKRYIYKEIQIRNVNMEVKMFLTMLTVNACKCSNNLSNVTGRSSCSHSLVTGMNILGSMIMVDTSIGFNRFITDQYISVWVW